MPPWAGKFRFRWDSKTVSLTNGIQNQGPWFTLAPCQSALFSGASPPPRLRSDSPGRNHSVIVPFLRLLFANVRERPRQAPGCRSVAAVHRSPSLHNPLTLPPIIPHPVYGICIQVAPFAETKRRVTVILVCAHCISHLIFQLIHAKLRF